MQIEILRLAKNGSLRFNAWAKNSWVRHISCRVQALRMDDSNLHQKVIPSTHPQDFRKIFVTPKMVVIIFVPPPPLGYLNYLSFSVVSIVEEKFDDPSMRGVTILPFRRSFCSILPFYECLNIHGNAHREMRGDQC